MARVLVVDDEPGVRTAVARGLTAEGMDVVAVGDGQSALRATVPRFDAVSSTSRRPVRLPGAGICARRASARAAGLGQGR
jgi:DNA-binding response OmpR family regulator